jgi:hypothetical protein
MREWFDPGAAMIPQHVMGERTDVFLHMCPANGCMQQEGNRWVANPLCSVCLGSGSISADRLDRWQNEEFAAHRRETGHGAAMEGK